MVSSAVGQLLMTHGGTDCFPGEERVPLSVVGFLF